MEKKAIFNTYSEIYDQVIRNTTAHITLLNHIVRDILLNLPPNTSIADVGAGTGLLLERLADYPYRLTAYEPNPNMAQYMKDKTLLKNIDVKQQPAEEVTGQYAGIVAVNVLYYVEEPLETIDRLLTSLEGNGIIALTGPNREVDWNKIFGEIIQDFKRRKIYDEMKTKLDTLNRCNKELLKGSNAHKFNADEISDILYSKGLEIITSRNDYYFDGAFYVATKKTH